MWDTLLLSQFSKIIVTSSLLGTTKNVSSLSPEKYLFVVYGNHYLPLVNTSRIRGCGVLSSQWDIYITFLPLKVRGSLWNWGWKDCKGQRAHMSAAEQYLLATAAPLHTVTHTAWDWMQETCTWWSQWTSRMDGGGAQEIPLLLEAAWGGRVSFLQKSGPWEATHGPIHSPVSKYIQQASLNIQWVKKKKWHMKLGGKSGGWL